MTSEIVIDVQPKEVSIALLEDKSLVELQSEGRNISFSVGNMYLGRIKKLMPGLNACFVDVGYAWRRLWFCGSDLMRRHCPTNCSAI